jgi:hypothetical protein
MADQMTNRVDRVTFCIGAVKTACHLPSYRSGTKQAFEAVRTDSLDPENISKPLENRYVTKETS